MDQDLLIFDGIDGATGGYLEYPTSVHRTQLLVCGESLDSAQEAAGVWF